MRLVPGLFGLLAVGCPTPHHHKDKVYTAEIGPEGGELSGGGVTLSVPPGALTETQTLSVRVSHEPAPDGGVALSPVYYFEPEGLQFAVWPLVQVELDEEGLGTMLWSTEDDEETFEEVGLAAGGLAEGYTAHFSSMYVGEGACSDDSDDQPQTTPEDDELDNECYCRASDDQGNLLCAEDPDFAGECDINAFSGSDGGLCLGFGKRPVLVPYCDCINEDYGALCPDEMIFEPSQQCPSDNGLNGFHGLVDDSCEGYTVDNDKLSGKMETCQDHVMDTIYMPVPGFLEGCTEVASQSKKKATVNRCSTAKDSWSEECLDVIGDYPKGRTEACPDLGDAATIGSTIGNQLEKLWTDSSPGTRLSQLEVPYGNKDDCKAGKSLKKRGPGKIDLAEVITQGNTVLLRIGEVKPLTRSGLDLGWKEVFDCYVPAINAAASKCNQAQMTSAERDFCKKVGGLGKTVALDSEPGVRWDLGNTSDLQVETCADGLVGYTCP